MKYGPRDAASILMYHRHKVALRFDEAKRWWTLDGKRVSLVELEDAAERYERIKDRTTPRP